MSSGIILEASPDFVFQSIFVQKKYIQWLYVFYAYPKSNQSDRIFIVLDVVTK